MHIFTFVLGIIFGVVIFPTLQSICDIIIMQFEVIKSESAICIAENNREVENITNANEEHMPLIGFQAPDDDQEDYEEDDDDEDNTDSCKKSKQIGFKG